MRIERRLFLQDMRDRLAKFGVTDEATFSDLGRAACGLIVEMMEKIDPVTDVRTEDVVEFVNARADVIKSWTGQQRGGTGLLAARKIAQIIDAALVVPPPAAQTHFPHMKNGDLRTMLERDLAEATDCLQRRHFKASMVLAGSILESALLDHFRRDGGKWVGGKAKLPKGVKKSDDIMSNDSRVWMLKNLIELAVENSILPEPASAGLKAWFWKARNLVHPAAELRKELEVSENMARKALAELQHALQVLASRPNWP